mmetsp:Transcript_26611/g.82290  ORF Transcript_26611/g.82290 Transcript_26611/m.82290 type:complete len:244 (-) Transcript_26611:170-901(-)
MSHSGCKHEHPAPLVALPHTTRVPFRAARSSGRSDLTSKPWIGKKSASKVAATVTVRVAVDANGLGNVGAGLGNRRQPLRCVHGRRWKVAQPRRRGGLRCAPPWGLRGGRRITGRCHPSPKNGGRRTARRRVVAVQGNVFRDGGEARPRLGRGGAAAAADRAGAHRAEQPFPQCGGHVEPRGEGEHAPRGRAHRQRRRRVGRLGDAAGGLRRLQRRQPAPHRPAGPFRAAGGGRVRRPRRLGV